MRTDATMSVTHFQLVAPLTGVLVPIEQSTGSGLRAKDGRWGAVR